MLSSKTNSRPSGTLPPESWQRIEELYLAALEHAPETRSVWLAQACPDNDALRGEVESLLAADGQAGDFLERRASEQFSASLPKLFTGFGLGHQIGPYRLVREIGQGGMGAVYLAERTDGEFHQRVAIKLVRQGFESDFLLRRFRHEREILARLEHPNIARLLDGGTTPEGVPYLAMEFVEGQPIDEYCRQRQLSLPARLELFRTVCAAVQYAHQTLVIHRDLKPGNILVTADGTPKLLDFGIAKLLDPENALAESTLTRQLPMTPEYASPEQTDGSPITTASDVYSLGVILYQLLTGQRPYEFKNRSAKEVADVIRHQEPANPSDAVRRARTGETGTGSPDKLRRALVGDLDNIVRKALRKEPEARYQSVEQLAEDVRRHLERLPVAARKGTFSYRSLKFAKRHWTGLTAALLLLLILLGGMAATAWQARLARAEKARAERRFNDVRQLANSFLFDFHEAIKDVAGATKARHLIVQKATKYLDSLAQEASTDTSLLRELARAYRQLGEIQGSVIDRANVGNSTEALASYHKALVFLERLATQNLADVELQQELSANYQRVGELLLESGNAAKALETYNKGVNICEQLATQRPQDRQKQLALVYAYGTLFRIQANTGHHLRSVETIRKVVERGEALYAADPTDTELRRHLVRSHTYYADSMWHLGYPEKAWPGYFRGLQLSQEWVAQEPNSSPARRALFVAYLYIGDMLRRYGRSREALDRYRQGMALGEEAFRQDPTNTQASRDLTAVWDRMSHAYAEIGNISEALKHQRRSQAGYEMLYRLDPQSSRYSRDVADSRIALGNLLAQRGDQAQALEHARRAQQIYAPLYTKDSTHVEIRKGYARALKLLAELLSQGGRASEARERSALALSLLKTEADKPETVGFYLHEYAWLLLTCEPPDLRDPDTALRYAKQAAELIRENDPTVLKTLALAYLLTGDQPRAIETVQKALKLLPPHNSPNSDSKLRRDLEALLAKSQASAKLRL